MVVSDYMMKLMFQKLYEPQRDWFGKKGVSLHGMMFFYLKRETWVWSQSTMTLSACQMTPKAGFVVKVVLKNVQRPSNRYIQTLKV